VPPGTRPLDLELFLSRIHPDERDALAATFDRALRTGGPYEWNHRILLPDGRQRDINGRGEVTLDDRGRPARGIAHDLNNALTPLAMALDELGVRHAADPVALTVVATGSDSRCRIPARGFQPA